MNDDMVRDELEETGGPAGETEEKEDTGDFEDEDEDLMS